MPGGESDDDASCSVDPLRVLVMLAGVALGGSTSPSTAPTAAVQHQVRVASPPGRPRSARQVLRARGFHRTRKGHPAPRNGQALDRQPGRNVARERGSMQVHCTRWPPASTRSPSAAGPWLPNVTAWPNMRGRKSRSIRGQLALPPGWPRWFALGMRRATVREHRQSAPWRRVGARAAHG